MYRRHVDDAAPVIGQHAGQCQARGVEGAGQVDGDDGVPLLHGEVLHAGHVLDAGVVDQDVHAAELGCGVLEHVLDLRGAAHVRAVVGHAGACGLAGGQHLGARTVHVAKAVEHDVRPLARERLGDAQADAAGGAGDEGGFAVQHESLSE